MFRDDLFFENFPSRIVDPDAEFMDDPDPVIVEIVPIEIDVIEGTSIDPNLIVTDSFTINIASSLFSTAEQEADEPVVQFIQARGASNNYTIVANTNGLLTWSPDPAVAAIRRE